MILRPILDPKIRTIRRLKSERLIGIAEYKIGFEWVLDGSWHAKYLKR